MIDESVITADIVGFYGVFGIESSILTLYLKISGSRSVAYSERFRESFRLIMYESGDGISAVACRITGNSIRYGSEYLGDEDVSGSGTFSFSVRISSEVCYVSSVCFGKIDSCSCRGFLDGGFIFIDKCSYLVSGNIDESVLIIYIIGSIRIG